MNRRAFLRSFGALAAAAVAGPTLAKLAPTDVERLVSAMKGGLIEGQTFYFTSPITIDIDNLVIRACRFVFKSPHPVDGAAITVKGNGLLMQNCHIDCSEMQSKYVMEFTGNTNTVINTAHFDLPPR